MSDLAPFVAAVLRDKTMADLQQELKAEKAKNERLQQDLRVIRVTGPGGFPVYAERHIQYAKSDFEDEYDLFLHNSTFGGLYMDEPPANPKLSTCQIQDVHKCELHIGGKEILVLGEQDENCTNSIVGDRNCSLTYIFRSDCPDEIAISFDFGPNPYPNDDRAFDPQNYRNEDIEFVCFGYVSFSEHPFDVKPSS